MRILGAITLFTYVTRRIISFSFSNDYSFKNGMRTFWLFYLCNINTVVLSLMLIFKAKKAYEYVLISGFIGGVLTFLVPNGVFTYKYLSFSIFDSVLSHYILVVVPPIFIVNKIWRPDYKKSYQVILGMLLVVLNAEGLQRLIFGSDYYDYIFINSGMPIQLVKYAKYQFLVVPVSFLLTLAFIYCTTQLVLRIKKKESLITKNAHAI